MTRLWKHDRTLLSRLLHLCSQWDRKRLALLVQWSLSEMVPRWGSYKSSNKIWCDRSKSSCRLLLTKVAQVSHRFCLDPWMKAIVWKGEEVQFEKNDSGYSRCGMSQIKLLNTQPRQLMSAFLTQTDNFHKITQDMNMAACHFSKYVISSLKGLYPLSQSQGTSCGQCILNMNLLTDTWFRSSHTNKTDNSMLVWNNSVL